MMSQVVIYTQAYNAENTIARAVKSILAQNFCGLKPMYLLINNGSTDSTGAIINKFAEECPWIYPIHLGMNIPSGTALVMSALRRCTEAGWFVHLDADDEYLPGFFEKTFLFMKANNLDIAACGIDLVDNATGGVISNRRVDQDFVVQRREFADQFISYRRFYIERWGKIYKLRLLKEWFGAAEMGLRRSSLVDFEDTLGIISLSDRIGVLAETLFRYYRFSDSYTGTFRGEHIPVLQEHADIIRHFLRKFGEIGKLNEDYIAAIYLGWCEHLLNLLDASNLPDVRKLGYITEMFSCTEMTNMLLRNGCDPQFRNLAERGEFIRHVRARILSAGGMPSKILISVLNGG